MSKPPDKKSFLFRRLSEKTIVDHLLAGFFGHMLPKDRKVGTLITVMSELFELIQAPPQDRSVQLASWITDDVSVKKCFQPRKKFSQFHDYLRSKNVPYTNRKSEPCRLVFAAICSVGRELLKEGVQSPRLRELQLTIGIVNEQGQLLDPQRAKAQRRVLGHIEAALKSVANLPSGAISFDSTGQPVFKIFRANDFQDPHIAAEEATFVEGRYVVYRKAFAPIPETAYVREYLQITKTQFGIECTWRSFGGPRPGNWTLQGVGFFCDGALWLMAHSNEHFKRVRMLAANVMDWHRHRTRPAKHAYCSALLLSHAMEHNQKVPEARAAVLRFDVDRALSDEEYERERIAAPVLRTDLDQILSSDELAIIDGCAVPQPSPSPRSGFSPTV